jgi:fructoselysine 6-kinase
VRAVAVGDNCLDVYVDLDQVTLGGNALNVAVSWLRHGVEARYVGAIGTDEAGPLVTDMAGELGLDASDIDTIEGSTGVTLIQLRRGNREFLYEEFGVSAKWGLDPEAAGALATQDWVHLAGPCATGMPLELLRDARARMSVDLSTDHNLPSLSGVEIAFASWTEGFAYGPDTLAARLLGAGARVAVVTCGAAGSVARVAGARASADAVAITPVDTTGAGDSFIASFVCEYAGGGTLQDALSTATAAATRTCMHVGGIDQRPRDVPHWLRANYYPLAGPPCP